MAQTNNTQPGIRNSWSLLAFAKMAGKMQVGRFTNKETGESFSSCIFTEPGTDNRTFVAFSSKLGEMSASSISKEKDNLQVVETNNDTFILCRKGENNWEDVEL